MAPKCSLMIPEQQAVSQPEMPAYESALWQELIRQRCGLHFSESRLRSLTRGLWERMQLYRMNSYRDYYHYIESHPPKSPEWQALLDHLLNHETGFFRHVPSFTALTEYVLPDLIHHRQPVGPVKMWSAGCSVGQEAYSLAMAFLNFISPPSAGHRQCMESGVEVTLQVKVIGSDISQRVLQKARCGEYKPHETRSTGLGYRQHYFTQVGDGHHMVYQVAPQVQKFVEFGYVNLHDPDSSPFAPLPFIGGRGEGIDVIFCQNVLIYFTYEDRVAIVQRLCQRLRPSGYLFLGPAEATGLHLPGMQPIRLDDMLIHQRIP